MFLGPTLPTPDYGWVGGKESQTKVKELNEGKWHLGIQESFKDGTANRTHIK